MTKTKASKALIGAWLAVLSLTVAGCWGAMQISPTTRPVLAPIVEDKDAGLVAVASGFHVSGWPCRNLISPLSQPRYTLLTLRPMV